MDATEGGIYGFEASMPLAIAAASLFGLSFVVHLIQMIYYKTKYFGPFTLGTFVMTIGYIFRALSIRSPENFALYSLQSLCIIIPPALYAATLYMTYSRIVVLVDEPQASLIRPQMITNFFVCMDMFSFLAQCGGGGMMAMKFMANTGERLEILGLALQVASFSIFLVLAITFRFRTRNATTEAATKKYNTFHWKQLLTALLIASVFIIVRCAYRIAEFSQGYRGFFERHEAYAYIVDALPMLCVQIMFNIIHSGLVFPRPGEGRESLEEFMKLKEER